MLIWHNSGHASAGAARSCAPKRGSMQTHHGMLHQVSERSIHLVSSWRTLAMWLLRPRGPWRGQAHAVSECKSWTRAHFFVLRDYIWWGSGMGPGAFSEWSINFPNSPVFWMDPPPNQSHLSPGRLTGLFGLALPLLQFQLLLHMYLSTLVPPLSGTRRGQGDFFLYPIILLVLHMFNVRTSLCCHLDQGRATPLVLHQLCTLMP